MDLFWQFRMSNMSQISWQRQNSTKKSHREFADTQIDAVAVKQHLNHARRVPATCPAWFPDVVRKSQDIAL